MSNHTVSGLDTFIRYAVINGRQKLGMSQADLANAMNERFCAGWFLQTVQKVESFNRGVSAAEFVALASILDIRMWVES